MNATRIIPVICLSAALFTSGYLRPRINTCGDNMICSGAKIPAAPAACLEEMNARLGNARYVYLAGRERVIIAGSDRIAREYVVKNGILWANSDPLIGNVLFFHFEYRDRFGNLILRPGREREEIESIAYTLTFNANPGLISTHYSTNHHIALSGALAMTF